MRAAGRILARRRRQLRLLRSLRVRAPPGWTAFDHRVFDHRAFDHGETDRPDGVKDAACPISTKGGGGGRGEAWWRGAPGLAARS